MPSFSKSIGHPFGPRLKYARLVILRRHFLAVKQPPSIHEGTIKLALLVALLVALFAVYWSCRSPARDYDLDALQMLF
jgi:hypothetical protein